MTNISVNLGFRILSLEYVVLGNKLYIKASDKVEMRLTVMKSEVKELNKLLCKDCDEKNYEKCRSCKVYVLINSLTS